MIVSPSSLDSPSTQTAGPLHVLTLTPFYPIQGDEGFGCFIAEPLPWLARLGMTNTVIAAQPFYQRRVQTSDSAPPAGWSRYFSWPGGFGLPGSGRFLFSKILQKVRELNRTHRIDVIHAHSALPCGHAAVLLGQELKIPVVVTVHGLDAFFTNQVRGRAGKKCEQLSQWVYRSAQRVICISQRVKDVVVGMVPANATVIYNGVDTGLFTPPAEKNVSQVILSVGDLIPIKGHELLLRAFAAVQRQHPNVSCEIIGEGPERVPLERLANELGIAGKVRLIGRKNRRQIADAMRGCLFFALPSRYEGLGCVYLEAMSSGKAVVGCNGQGIAEIIHHKSNGWLIDTDSLPSMTDALLRLLEDQRLREQIGISARQTVEQQYSLARQSQMLVRQYRECLA